MLAEEERDAETSSWRRPGGGVWTCIARDEGPQSSRALGHGDGRSNRVMLMQALANGSGRGGRWETVTLAWMRVEEVLGKVAGVSIHTSVGRCSGVLALAQTIEGGGCSCGREEV